LGRVVVLVEELFPKIFSQRFFSDRRDGRKLLKIFSDRGRMILTDGIDRARLLLVVEGRLKIFLLVALVSSQIPTLTG
jgi:hypothetical protein